MSYSKRQKARQKARAERMREQRLAAMSWCFELRDSQSFDFVPMPAEGAPLGGFRGLGLSKSTLERWAAAGGLLTVKLKTDAHTARTLVHLIVLADELLKQHRKESRKGR